MKPRFGFMERTVKKMATFIISLFVAIGVFGPVPGADAQDCSRIKRCLPRCQCFYDRCYAGCENYEDSKQKYQCMSGCDAFYRECTNRC